MFISHSSKDTVVAARLLRLLRSFGLDNVFLDAEPGIGLLPGKDFVGQLADRHSEAGAYFFLISKSWLESAWCNGEYRAALALKRARFAILIEDIDRSTLPVEMRAEQFLVWADPSFGERLQNAVDRTLRERGRVRQRDIGKSRLQKGGAQADLAPLAFRARVEKALRLSKYDVADVVATTRGAVDFLCSMEDTLHTATLSVTCWPRLGTAFEIALFEQCLVDALAFSAASRSQQLVVCHGDAIDPALKERLATNQRLRTVSFSDLEAASIRYRDYLAGTTSKYRSYVTDTFVDLDANYLDVRDGKPNTVANVSQYLTQALLTGEAHFAFVLGDFGTGKTTVAERVHREVAEAYLRGEAELFPMLFYLRTLALFANEEKFVQHQTSEAAPGVPPTLLEEMRQRGEVLVILDGFDEVASNSTYQERSFYFSRIFEIAKRCNRLLLTSRPTVFTNFDELDQLVQTISEYRTKAVQAFRHNTNPRDHLSSGAQDQNAALVRARYSLGDIRRFPADRTAILTLMPLSKEKIISFFEPYADEIWTKHRKSPKQIYDILLKIYDLTDIITRPLLLDMFIYLLRKGKIELDDPALKVGSVSLYQQYIETHLLRESGRTPYLSKQARRDFASAAASAMLEAGGTLEASFNAIASIVKKMAPDSFVGIDIIKNLENVVTDVRNCGFLKITADDKVAFSHKSFMEFFIADTIYRKISENEYSVEMEKTLNYEILQFVGGFAMARQAFRMQLRQHLSKLRQSVPPLYAMNQKIAMMFSEVELREHKFSGIDIEGLTLRRRKFVECSFDNVFLGLVDIDRVEFSNCEFKNTSLLGQIRDSKFFQCTGVIETDESVADIEFRNCQLTLPGATRLENVSVRASEIFQAAPAQSMEIVDSTVRDSVLWLSGGQTAFSVVGATLQNVLVCFGPKSGSRAPRDAKRFDSDLLQKDAQISTCCLFAFEFAAKLFRERRGSFNEWAGLIVIDEQSEEFLDFSHLVDTKVQSGSIEKVKRYKGWTIDNGQLLVSSRWWKRHSAHTTTLRTDLREAAMLGRSFRRAITSWFSEHQDLFGDNALNPQ